MGGGISRMAKQELVATIRDRYQQASKKDEGRILDEFTAITVGGEFVAVMEDVLDLYPEPCDPQRPVVCFDETSTQLLAETKAHCRRGPDAPGAPGARTTNTCALAPATCFSPASPRQDGAMWRLPNGAPCRTSPISCAGWWMRPNPTSR